MATVARSFARSAPSASDRTENDWRGSNFSDLDELAEAYDFDTSFDDTTLEGSQEQGNISLGDLHDSTLGHEIDIPSLIKAKGYTVSRVISKSNADCSATDVAVRSSPSSGFNSGSFDEHFSSAYDVSRPYVRQSVYDQQTTYSCSSKEDDPDPYTEIDIVDDEDSAGYHHISREQNENEDTEGYEYIETVNPSVIYNIQSKLPIVKPPSEASSSNKEFSRPSAPRPLTKNIASNFLNSPHTHEVWGNETEFWKLENAIAESSLTVGSSRVVGRREGRLRKKERERRKSKAVGSDVTSEEATLHATDIKSSKSDSELRGIDTFENIEKTREEINRKKKRTRGKSQDSRQGETRITSPRQNASRPPLCSSCLHPIAACKCQSTGCNMEEYKGPLYSSSKRSTLNEPSTSGASAHPTPSKPTDPFYSKSKAYQYGSAEPDYGYGASKMDSPSKGTKKKSRKQQSKSSLVHHHHQPALLKTVSIMDTLSEIAGVNDVNKLSQPRPPSVSSDFRHYSEKIYDAVTSRDISSSQLTNKQALSERGQRAPEWIKKIFDAATKCDLQSLKYATVDMDGTLLRNLSDPNGNNLVHVSACLGHVSILSWLMTSLPEMSDALNDENKFGQTPTVCAVKYGHLSVLQWLVENTNIKDKVKSKEGERSLLHLVAKYEQEEMVLWLVSHMTTIEVTLDTKDHYGNTALHLAARTGNSRICSLLLQHGVDLTIKNDLGQKAWEVCVVRGHIACAEYLCVHEAGLSLATDLTKREAELEAATSDNHDLRIGFKEVITVARRLLKEREEVMRELSRLNDQMMETHHDMLTVMDETCGGNDGEASAQQSETYDNVSRNISVLHDRWQTAQKTWFSSSLVDLKHRMLLVEEAWKKLRTRSHRTVATTHHPLDVFRGKVLNVRSQGGEGRLGDLPSLCSSEESIPNIFPLHSEEDIYEGINREEMRLFPPSAEHRIPPPIPPLMALRDNPASHMAKSRAVYAKSNASELLQTPPTKKILHGDVKAKKIDFSSHESTPSSLPMGRNHSEPMTADDSMESRHIVKTPQISKQEIANRLKNLALTSESGSCSILEVIDPSSDESDGDQHVEVDDDLKKELESAKILQNELNKQRGLTERKVRRLTKGRYDQGWGGLNNRMGQVQSSKDVYEVTTSSDSGGDPKDTFSNVSAFSLDRKSVNRYDSHLLTSEASGEAAASDVSNVFYNQRHDVPIIPDEHDSSKRRGFLHKFSIKPMKPIWPANKRKTVKQVSKRDDITLSPTLYFEGERFNERSVDDPVRIERIDRLKIKMDDFNSEDRLQDTLDSSTIDTDPQSTPEICTTSSSQECSQNNSSTNNSSEESNSAKFGIASTSSKMSPREHNSPAQLSSLMSPKQRAEICRPPPLLSDSLRLPPPVPRTRRPPPPFSANLGSLNYGSSKYSKESFSPSLSREVLVEEDGEDLSAHQISELEIRPESSASKFESVSRPASSTSTFPNYKSEHSLLQKSNLSLTHDMLPNHDSITSGRMSPAPSEVSKTESALSPPSHASDVSKSESSRQLNISKISSLGSNNSCSLQNNSTQSSLHSKEDINLDDSALDNLAACEKIKTGQNSKNCDVNMDKNRRVMESQSSSNQPSPSISSRQNLRVRTRSPSLTSKVMQDHQYNEDGNHPSSASSVDGNSTLTKKTHKLEKPWYELSDEEYDILLPDTMNIGGKLTTHTTSSEDESALC